MGVGKIILINKGIKFRFQFCSVIQWPSIIRDAELQETMTDEQRTVISQMMNKTEDK